MFKLLQTTRATKFGSALQLAMCALAASGAIAAQPELRVRIIQYGLDEPIAARLRPDDEMVIVHRDFDVAVPDRQPTALEAVRDAVERAQLVAVIDATEVGGMLVNDGTWIDTRIVGITRDVLYSSNRNESRGQRVDVRVPGGQMRIGQVLVKAGEILQLRAGEDYLLFLKEAEQRRILYPTYTPLLVQSGQLVSTRPPNASEQFGDPLPGLPLAEVAGYVRQVAGLPRVPPGR